MGKKASAYLAAEPCHASTDVVGDEAVAQEVEVHVRDEVVAGLRAPAAQLAAVFLFVSFRWAPVRPPASCVTSSVGEGVVVIAVAPFLLALP